MNNNKSLDTAVCQRVCEAIDTYALLMEMKNDSYLEMSLTASYKVII